MDKEFFMKIAVLGSTGMLGSAVGHHFMKKYGEENVFTSYRTIEVSYGGMNSFYLNPFAISFEPTLDDLGHLDYVVNALGITKPFIAKNIEESIFVNSIFPWRLADYCNRKEIKLISITSDCVFGGKEGNYTEASLHDCTDVYGKTKSLGEPDDCMVLRTSIIGEEIHKNASLIEWIKAQKNGKANGFTNHLWNGVTTKQYAKICETIIDNDLYEPSLFHVFSDIVTKEQLLHMVNDRFNLNITINACEAPERIDRTLATIKPLNTKLNIPPLAEQIKNL